MSAGGRRRGAGRAALVAGVEALLVTHLPDVRYLSGFTGSNAALVVMGSGSRAVLFTDGRYTVQAKAEAAGVRVVIATGPVVVAACAWMEAAGVRRCGFDEGTTTVGALDGMRRAVAGKLRRGMFQTVGPLVAQLRWIKDESEIAAMRAAAAVGCGLFEQMLGVIQPGMTEIAVAAELEHRARLAGVEGMSFETIVASGERSSLPHGRATLARLPGRGFCTLDFGVVLGGYSSDMTRTVHLGRARRVGDWKEREVYDSVLEAQVAAVAKVAPGVTCGDVDEAARAVLRRDGYADFFTHSTGHGVGLEIHEGPRIAAKQTQVLEAGMVITIEPGAYLPGSFGVRIEDMVLVTKMGGEVLTGCTKGWVEL